MRTTSVNFLKNLKPGIESVLLSIGVALLLFACGGAQDAVRPQNFEELKELAEGREFEIENEWAMPLGGNNVNLIGNPNFIRFKGDSVDIFLPYFGVRHFGGTYGGRDGGIIYEGPAEDFSIDAEEEKNRVVLKFEGRHENEDLEFIITLFPGGNAYTSVNSSQRSNISYRGEVKELPEEHRN